MKKCYILSVYFLCINFIIINLKQLDIPNLQEEPNELQEYIILPKPEYVRFIGRYAIKDDIVWLTQSGSGIEFYLNSTYREVIITGEENILTQTSEQRPRYAVFINDELDYVSMIWDIEDFIDLNYLDEIEYKIKIILVTEATNGGIGIKSINVETNNKNMEDIIRPTEKKKLKIEFIGDSITCANGVEAESMLEPFKSSTENIILSYAYLAAEKLNADYSFVSYTGARIMADDSSNEKNILPKMYTKTGIFSEYGQEWNFDNDKIDIIFINLGSNDCNYVMSDSKIRDDSFIQEYVNFLELIRKKNPDSFIICSIGIMGAYYMLPLIEKAVILFGDKKVTSLKLPSQDSKSEKGAQFHPNENSHKIISEFVANEIEDFLDRFEFENKFCIQYLKGIVVKIEKCKIKK